MSVPRAVKPATVVLLGGFQPTLFFAGTLATARNDSTQSRSDSSNGRSSTPVTARMQDVEQIATGPDCPQFRLLPLRLGRLIVDDRSFGAPQLRQQLADSAVDCFHPVHLSRPGQVALAAAYLHVLEQADVAVGVVAHGDRHPRPVILGLRILTQQHHLDAVLPRPHVLLVRGLDRADVVGGQARDRLPAAAAQRRPGRTSARR